MVTLECWLISTAVVKETVLPMKNCNLVNVTTKVNVATVYVSSNRCVTTFKEHSPSLEDK